MAEPSYKLMKENGPYVRKMLKKGKYDDASLTGWGRLDELVAVMVLFKVFKIFSKIKVNVRDECEIPRWFINNTMALKLVLGEKGINSIQDGMFKDRSEEHTSELQSHSFISYAVFCLKKKKKMYITMYV